MMRIVGSWLFLAALFIGSAHAGEVREAERKKGEPNPNVIRPGDVFVGTFESEHQRDEIVLELEEDTICRITVTVPDGQAISLYLQHAGWFPGECRDGRPLVYRYLRIRKGKSEIWLKPNHVGEETAYRLTVEPVDPAGVADIEPNGSERDPLPLTLGEAFRGMCSFPAEDRDVFTLRVKSRGVHLLRFQKPREASPEGAELRGRIDIETAGGTSLYSYRFGDIDEKYEFYPVLDPGEYSLELVVTKCRSGAEYELSLGPYTPVVTAALESSARRAVERGTERLLEGVPRDTARGTQKPFAVESLVLAALSEGGGYEKRRELIDREYVAWLGDQFKPTKVTWEGEPVLEPATDYIYSSAIVTLALAEAAAAGCESARPLAEAGARFLLAAQQTGRKPEEWDGPVPEAEPVHGGWRYSPGAVDADISVTGWCWIALSAVAAAKIDVPGIRSALDAGSRYVIRCGGRLGFGYETKGSRSPTDCLQSIGALVLLLSGEEEKALRLALEQVDRHLPAGTQCDSGMDYCLYYAYYATRVNYLRGGYPWLAWRAIMIRQLLRRQDEDGRWVATGGEASIGDRYTTALAVMVLRMCLNEVPHYLQQEERGF